MLDVESLRVVSGQPAGLDRRDPRSKIGFDGDKTKGKQTLPRLRELLAGLQYRLWAEGERSLLVVLQALDTGGKDGTIRHVFRGVNPQGVKVWSFGAPSVEELAHDYLWRVHRRTPRRGTITIFNRSHYEDVLAVRVRQLVPETRWRRRYDHIMGFERLLADEGTAIVKLFLHISRDEQRKRLQDRIDQPEKSWKFDPGDLEDRRRWDDYMAAYEEAITRTSIEEAPWYVVPADRKWYRNLVVSSILIRTLEEMDPRIPSPNPGLKGLVVE